MKVWIQKILPIADILLFLFVYPAAWLLKNIRWAGVHRLPLCKNALITVGVFPVRNHYYEPQFDFRTPNPAFSTDRDLPGIDWNVSGQLESLDKLIFTGELDAVPRDKAKTGEFYMNNGAFESGDAEYWYQIIRATKPKRIIEIGSGHSTLMAIKAIDRNFSDDPKSQRCEHLCVEPYEVPWLEEVGVSVVRKKVEELELSFFSRLEENDILFIDSTHVIRPQGDVLFEYLQLLPSLKKGVIVHIHDIFSPKNYPNLWLQGEVRLWNEQYLLEAFLTHNRDWRLVGALNFLRHHHYERLKEVAPSLTPEREPGSFYIQRIA